MGKQKRKEEFNLDDELVKSAYSLMNIFSENPELAKSLIKKS